MKRAQILPILMISATFSANAGVITLVSSAATTTNNSGNPTIDIAKHPAWANPLPGSNWVSTDITGDTGAPGYVVFPNDTLILFSHTFMLNSAVTDASISIMADDTSSVLVNGTQIFAAPNPAAGYPTCSAEPIGCLTSTTRTFTAADLAPFLSVGSNTISFGVVQKAGVSYGLNYAGSITEAPEPGTFAVLGAGLCGIAFWSRRRAPINR